MRGTPQVACLRVQKGPRGLERAMNADVAIQIPIWIVLPVLLLIGFGLWMLVKLLFLTRG